MKSVLISIKPKWCELIKSGKKTIEVRRTRPKIETPFKCYIYCTMGEVRRFHGHRTKATKNTVWLGKSLNNISPGRYTGNGMVIGEFVCDKIYDIEPHYDTPNFCNQYVCGWKDGDADDCISFSDLNTYLGGKHGYGWHISDLKIYDKPKELGNFWKADKCPFATESGCTYKYHCFRTGQTQRCGEKLTRPPQSYMFVEELPWEE